MTVQVSFGDGTTRIYTDVISLGVCRESQTAELHTGGKGSRSSDPWLMLLHDVVRLKAL